MSLEEGAWSPECIACSVDSVQQPTAKTKLQACRPRSVVQYVSCLKCQSKMCSVCIKAFHDLIMSDVSIPTSIKERDPSVFALSAMKAALDSGQVGVACGTCCSFRGAIPASTKSTSVKPPRAPELSTLKDPPLVPALTAVKDPLVPSSSIDNDHWSTPCGEDDSCFIDTDSIEDDDQSCDNGDDDFIFVSRKEANKSLRSGIRRLAGNIGNVRFLHRFHDFSGQLKWNSPRISDMLKRVNKKKRKRGKPSYCHNKLQGSLVLPEFGLILQADATNEHWYCDHHALAQSEADGTPAVLHGVLTESMSQSVKEYMEKNQLSFAKLEEGKKIVLDVPSPEDPSRSRPLYIEIRSVDQLYASEDVAHLKGATEFDPSLMAPFRLFSHEDISDDVDFLIILGHFTPNKNDAKAPKMLLLRSSSMLCNYLFSREQREEFAREIYASLRSYAGKRGYEMRRFCGSSGLVSDQTNKNLLSVLHEHEGSLPRKVYGCVIVSGVDRYFLAYCKTKIQDKKKQYTLVKYSPPQDGGQFDLPSVAIAQFPPIAEMIYLKMYSIVILTEINEVRKSIGLPPVAIGPLSYEYPNVQEAREVYARAQQSNEDDAMFKFLDRFNSFNHYSMVAYACGMHHDIFKNGKESIENKLLFCLLSKGNKIGRGGSFTGTQYVYCLLDW